MPVPTITSATTATGTVGQAFSYQIVATNSPTSYTARYLPVGTVLNSTTGLIEGPPETSGTFVAHLRAMNSLGQSDPVFMLTVTVAQPTYSSTLTIAPNFNGAAGTTAAGNSNTTGGTPRTSQGNYQTLTATTNGTEVPNRPTYTNGLYVYAPNGSQLQWFIAPTGTTPTGPANGNQIKKVAGADTEYPIYLSGSDSVFVTLASAGTGTGTPPIQVQWVQR